MSLTDSSSTESNLAETESNLAEILNKIPNFGLDEITNENLNILNVDKQINGRGKEMFA